MKAYALYVLDLTQIHTPEQHSEALKQIPTKYFDSLKEAEAFCGGKLRRMNGAFCGTNDSTEYIAYKITI